MTTQTPVFGFPVEVTSDAPGTTLREPGSLAQAVEDTLTGHIFSGARIATTIETTDSAHIGNTETVVSSVTAPLEAGRTYRFRAIGKVRADSASAVFVARLREDDLVGTTMDGRRLIVEDDLWPLSMEGEYTAASTANKTFVLTLVRVSGSGDIWLRAFGAAAMYLYVDYIRG